MRSLIFQLSCVALLSLLSLKSTQAQTLSNCQPAPPLSPTRQDIQALNRACPNSGFAMNACEEKRLLLFKLL
jgi:hypothetical protein